MPTVHLEIHSIDLVSSGLFRLFNAKVGVSCTKIEVEIPDDQYQIILTRKLNGIPTSIQCPECRQPAVVVIDD